MGGMMSEYLNARNNALGIDVTEVNLNMMDGINASFMNNTYSGIYESDYMDNDIIDLIMANFRKTLQTHDDPQSIVLICLYVPVFLGAFIGNILVLLVILTNKNMKSTTNYFLLNLGVADLLVTTLCMPMAIGKSVYKLWIYGVFMCKTTGYFQGVAVATSVLTITSLSIDRYLAIRHPMTARRFCKTTYAKRLLPLLWGASCAIMVPLIVVREVVFVHIFDDSLPYCNEEWKSTRDRQLYDVFILIILFLIPGFIITTSYLKMGCHLWSEGRDLHTDRSFAHGSQIATVMAGRRRVARMLIVLTVIFAITWLPYNIVTVYINFVDKKKAEPSLLVLPFTLWLAHAHSAFNPILYCFMNRNFRRGLRKLFRCRRSHKRCEHGGAGAGGHGVVKTITKRRQLLRNLSSSSLFSRSNSTSGSLKLTRTTSNSSTNTRTSRNTFKLRTAEETCGDKTRFNEGMVRSPYGECKRFPDVVTDHQETCQDTTPNGIEFKCDNAENCSRRKKEIFSCKLNIPTTITEESSRCRSVSPNPFISHRKHFKTHDLEN
ncbi:unnamed protein product [Owenia fusiformis]|uniref:G-protein coupled receptors family 1 profile domain-containing protein n=1 Tax=Owenia fusiformis TaxID=6347 RepID=A0A8S4N581_OWEFU|nr:unnamed protein product [Owenia fusiformis]